jgi:hypothetical protein
VASKRGNHNDGKADEYRLLRISYVTSHRRAGEAAFEVAVRQPERENQRDLESVLGLDESRWAKEFRNERAREQRRKREIARRRTPRFRSGVGCV